MNEVHDIYEKSKDDFVRDLIRKIAVEYTREVDRKIAECMLKEHG